MSLFHTSIIKTIFCLFFLVAFKVVVAQPGSNDPTFNTFDDGTFGDGSGFSNITRSCSIQPDGKILVGGEFINYNGIPTSRIARLNVQGGLDVTFDPGSGFNNSVRCINTQSDGKIVVGGQFTSFNGILINRIARLNADGSLDDTFNTGTGFNGTVVCATIQADGKIIVGGAFTEFNGNAVSYIARLNADGTIDPSFNSGTGFDSAVNSVNIQSDGKIILGGQFTSFNGTLRNNIARLNSDGSLDVSFNPGSGFNSFVLSTSIQVDGKIIVGGIFTVFNGITRNRVARLNANGSLDTTFDPGAGANNIVFSVALQSNGKIVIGGQFTSYNGTTRNSIARLNTNGSNDVSFNSSGQGFNSVVRLANVQQDGKIIIGGEFTAFNGFNPTHNYFTRLTEDGNLDSDFTLGTGFDNVVLSTSLQADEKIIAAGQFTLFNGMSINRIVRLNTEGNFDATFDTGTGFNNSVAFTSIQSDGKIIVGGQFSSFNGVLINRIARLNQNGSLDATFDIGTGFNSTVRSINIQTDGKIVVGGSFTEFNGTTVNRIIRLNSDGTIDPSFDSGVGFNGDVRSLNIQTDGKIIVGGDFTSFNGVTRNYITRLNSDGSLDVSFNPGSGFNNSVYSSNIQVDGKIIVGGSYTNFDGTARNRIARLNTDGSLDALFDPGTGFNNTVWSTNIQSDGQIVVGGEFISFNGIFVKRLARLNQVGSLDTTFNQNIDFNSGVNNNIFTISIAGDGKIIVGGTFTKIDGIWRNRIARLSGCSISAVTDVVSSCSSYTWIDGIEYTSSNNTATYTLTNAAGCDSIVTLNLTIDTPVSADVLTDLTICDTYELPVLTTGNYFTETNGGGTQLNAGDLVDATQTLYVYAENGTCSDETSFIVTIDDPIQVDEQNDLTACDPYELPVLTVGNYFTETSGGGTQMNAGDTVDATQTLYVYAENGTCSDETSFTVTINENPDNGISLDGLTLSADAIGADYLWLDCNNAFAPISGETGQSFTATANGSYAVQVSANGCELVSECVEITTVDLDESMLPMLTIHPNPSSGLFYVITEHELEFELRNIQGQIIQFGRLNQGENILDLSDRANGIYIISIGSDNKRLLKQ